MGVKEDEFLGLRGAGGSMVLLDSPWRRDGCVVAMVEVGGGGVRRTWRWRDALGDLKEAFSVALEIWWVIQLLLGELVVIFFYVFYCHWKRLRPVRFIGEFYIDVNRCMDVVLNHRRTEHHVCHVK